MTWNGLCYMQYSLSNDQWDGTGDLIIGYFNGHVWGKSAIHINQFVRVFITISEWNVIERKIIP